MEKKLYRDELHKKIAGVCAGLAEYFNVDVTLVRVLFALTLILKGGGVVAYVILWIVLPVKNYFYNNSTVDYKVPPFGSPAPFSTPETNTGEPFMPPPARRRSNGTTIAGAFLILLGSFFLLDEFDIIPDWDFSRLWPVVPIVLGLVLIVSYKKQPWEHKDWHKTGTDQQEETTNENNTTL